MALPNIRDMIRMYFGPASAVLGMFVMESTMNDADRAWMKSEPKSLDEALKASRRRAPFHFSEGPDELMRGFS